MATAEHGKLTHAEVHYGMAKQGGDRCAGCKFYEGPNDCELVASPIYPAGWCDKFQPAGTSVARDPVMAHGRAIAGARALHAVGHITPGERDRHIGRSHAAIRKATPRKPFGSFMPR
jgi:hypothetical protein